MENSEVNVERDTSKPEDLALESERQEGEEATELDDLELDSVAGGNPLILTTASGAEVVQPGCSCGSANGAGAGGDCGCGTSTGAGA